jgi:hypothetical protein
VQAMAGFFFPPVVVSRSRGRSTRGYREALRVLPQRRSSRHPPATPPFSCRAEVSGRSRTIPSPHLLGDRALEAEQPPVALLGFARPPPPGAVSRALRHRSQIPRGRTCKNNYSDPCSARLLTEKAIEGFILCLLYTTQLPDQLAIVSGVADLTHHSRSVIQSSSYPNPHASTTRPTCS